MGQPGAIGQAEGSWAVGLCIPDTTLVVAQAKARGTCEKAISL